MKRKRERARGKGKTSMQSPTPNPCGRRVGKLCNNIIIISKFSWLSISIFFKFFFPQFLFDPIPISITIKFYK